MSFVIGNYTYTILLDPTTVSLTAVNSIISGNIILTSPVVDPSTSTSYILTTIGDRSFSSRSNITSLVIPNSVNSILAGAFLSCSAMISITLPINAAFITINPLTFFNCLIINNVTIPSSITTIQTYAFPANCPLLLKVTFAGTTLPFINPSNNFSITGNTAYYPQYAAPLSNISPFFTYLHEVIPIIIICFKEDSKILCLIDNTEVYLPIQDIRKGVLIKTRLNGYIPVNMIGTSKIYNSGNKARSQNRLYKCSPANYPGLTEDLFITGCHSILVDYLSDEQREKNNELLGKVFLTENRYRLMACIDDRAEPYECEGVFNIWHLALENEDDRMNYGIYANGGLLVETTSKRMLLNYSGMDLL